MTAREKQGHPGADKELGSVVHIGRTPTGPQLLWSILRQAGLAGAGPWGFLGAELGVMGEGRGCWRLLRGRPGCRGRFEGCCG